MHDISILRKFTIFCIYADYSSETKVTVTLQWLGQGSLTNTRYKVLNIFIKTFIKIAGSYKCSSIPSVITLYKLVHFDCFSRPKCDQENKCIHKTFLWQHWVFLFPVHLNKNTVHKKKSQPLRKIMAEEQTL